MHWLAVLIGINNASGHTYLLWSGIVGDITIFGAGIAIYRKHTCHEPRCFRLGHHAVAGTPFTACRKHHPAMPNKATKGHMTVAWHEAGRRTR